MEEYKNGFVVGRILESLEKTDMHVCFGEKKLPWEGSEEPVSEVLETLLLRNRQKHMSAITIPTNATAPAAPPTIAARDPDIGYGNHFTLCFAVLLSSIIHRT